MWASAHRCQVYFCLTCAFSSLTLDLVFVWIKNLLKAQSASFRPLSARNIMRPRSGKGRTGGTYSTERWLIYRLTRRLQLWWPSALSKQSVLPCWHRSSSRLSQMMQISTTSTRNKRGPKTNSIELTIMLYSKYYKPIATAMILAVMRSSSPLKYIASKFDPNQRRVPTLLDIVLRSHSCKHIEPQTMKNESKFTLATIRL